MPHESNKNKRLIGVFLLGALFFNFPLLSLFNHKSYVLGVPLLYLYIFSIWILVIVMMIFATSHNRTHDRQAKKEA